MTTAAREREKKGTYVRITFKKTPDGSAPAKTADGKLIVAKTEVIKPSQSAARSMRYSG